MDHNYKRRDARLRRAITKAHAAGNLNRALALVKVRERNQQAYLWQLSW